MEKNMTGSLGNRNGAPRNLQERLHSARASELLPSPTQFGAVDIGDEITLSQAYEPVIGGNFPAHGPLRTGTVQAIRPTASRDAKLALVYMTENQRGWWLKVPTDQDKLFVVKPDADPAFDQGPEAWFENMDHDVAYTMDTSWLQERSDYGPAL